MMDSFDVEQLIGNMEAWYEKDEQISSLKEQIKMLTKDRNGEIQGYAKEIDVTKKVMTEAYRHYKKAIEGDVEPDELYEIIGRIDIALEEEKEKEGENANS
jgi:hydrogenase maturation factor HypE